MAEKKLRPGKWESRVFVFNKRPTKEQAEMAGIGGKSQVIVKCRTNASFEPDQGIDDPILKKIARQTTDGQRLPIDITDVEIVDFR